jgi:hypothetical protein
MYFYQMSQKWSIVQTHWCTLVIVKQYFACADATCLGSRWRASKSACTIIFSGCCEPHSSSIWSKKRMDPTITRGKTFTGGCREMCWRTDSAHDCSFNTNNTNIAVRKLTWRPVFAQCFHATEMEFGKVILKYRVAQRNGKIWNN